MIVLLLHDLFKKFHQLLGGLGQDLLPIDRHLLY